LIVDAANTEAAKHNSKATTVIATNILFFISYTPKTCNRLCSIRRITWRVVPANIIHKGLWGFLIQVDCIQLYLENKSILDGIKYD
jgi:hypothetical protein